MGRRVATKPLDPIAVAAADAAVAPETGGRPIGRNEDELQKKWMDAYIAAGGDVQEEGEPRGRAPDDTCETCQDKKIEVKLVELEYLSDHNELKDNMADWKNTGSKYPTPDWTSDGKSNPITHSMRERLRLEVVLEVSPADASPEPGRLIGRIGGAVVFNSGKVTFSPGKRNEIKVRSNRHVIGHVRQQKVDIDWQVASKKTYRQWTNIGTSTTDPWFTTFGPPKDGAGFHWVAVQDGPTYLRMETAVEWVGHEGTTKHSKILEYMFSHFDRYVLGISHLSEDEQKRVESDADLKRRMGEVDWPGYFEDDVGAWPIVELQEWGAECQAICRLVLGMLRQTGSKQDVKLVYVAADFSDPEKPVVSETGTEPTGPDSSKEYALADAPVEVGRTYWPPKRGEQAEVGWNNFEAYLRYNYKGYLRWYGGGVGLIEQGMNPLHVFHALVEYEWVRRTVTAGGRTRAEHGRKVTNAHFYR